jgi:ABC-2 type transport system permease protein
MKKLKKALLWWALLTKRLYKKATFLAILALIPLLVVGYRGIARGDSGMFTVALVQEGNDSAVSTIFQNFQSSQILRFVHCDTEEDARELVQTGKVDTAWIFPEDFTARVDNFITRPSSANSVVTVLLREDDTTQMLARERLSGEIYEYLAQRLFVIHTRQENPKLPEMTDEEMLAYYQGAEVADKLFTFDETENKAVDPGHYLLTPVRGLLAVVITLSALASAMYYNQDEKNGTFGWVSRKKQIFTELACQLVAVVNVALVALIATALTGLSGTLLPELGALVIMSLGSALFAMLLRRLLPGNAALGTAIPLVIVVMLLVCPVFMDLAVLRQLQILFPPTYYIQGIHNPMYLLYGTAYSAIVFALCLPKSPRS